MVCIDIEALRKQAEQYKGIQEVELFLGYTKGMEGVHIKGT